ncbi:Trk system potassium transporter TrkH [Synergistales bacterium]|nr:Trk system potassium transporter TrkH [Synergistales bacterium]
MRFRIVARCCALVSGVVSLCMVFPVIWSGLDKSADFTAFTFSIAFGLTASYAFFRLAGSAGDAKAESLGIREAVAVVVLSWITAAAIGALPYYTSDALPRFTDAFFEAMSGFTTTGATVLADVEAVPRGLLFWRAMTHWLGGMGIIVLSLAVLPFLGMSGMELYKAESPGPTPEKMTPRMRQTALWLWGVYVLLTACETALLSCELDFFDALAHSLSTIATGGFSTKNASIAAYNSPYVEWVATVFMFLSGLNFSVHFLVLTNFSRFSKAGFLRVLKETMRKITLDSECGFYTKVVAVSSLTVFVSLLLSPVTRFWSVEQSLRASFFQVVSVVSTTGFVAEHHSVWLPFVRVLLIILMLIGACAGSTGGGIKMVRAAGALRLFRSETVALLHPRAVLVERGDGRLSNGRRSAGAALSSTAAFFVAYILIFFASSLLVSLFDIDIGTVFSLVLSSMSNVGPALGFMPPGSYAPLPWAVKWILGFCMLAGRLELYPAILMFSPETWRRR